MGLKSILGDFVLDILSPSSIEAPKKLASTAEKIFRELSGVIPKSPPPTDLQSIYNQLAKQYTQNAPLDGLLNVTLKRVPWVLFSYPDENPGILGRHQKFMRHYLEWLVKYGVTGAVSTLHAAYLSYYPKDFDTFNFVRATLQKLLLQNSRSFRMKALYQKSEQYHLLHENGPQLLAKDILASEEPLETVLDSAGLTGILGSRGFIKEVFRYMLKSVQESLSTGKPLGERFDRLIEICNTPEGVEGKLRFGDLKIELAESLLLPFASGAAPQSDKDRIQDFLLDRIGDPRIQQEKWIGVNPKATAVLLNWLVGVSLDLFFQILDKTADPMWRYRKAFWNTYYKRGHLKEAWLALGSSARGIARRLENKKLAYGRLVQAASNQSVLLMRIENLVIAEWSHSGKCRFWVDVEGSASPLAPMLYNNLEPYEGTRLRQGSDHEIIHYSADTYGWQIKCADFIKEHTNIYIPQIEYKI